MENTMKRIQFHRYGGSDEMKLENYELPSLGAKEVLVRVKAASVNPVDWKIRQGAMKFLTGKKFPRGMGQDFSGVIERVGSGVKRFRVGDEVFGSTPVKTSGSFAETLITQEKLVTRKPVALSHEEAATLPVAGSTALIALTRKAHLKSGQKIFINGAHGAVGRAATQVAKMLGASVTGRVGTHSMSAAMAHGMEMVLDINPSPAKMLRIVFSPSRKFVMGKQDTATLNEVGELASKGTMKIPIGRKVGLPDAIGLIKDLEAGIAKGKGVIVNAA